VMETEMEMNHGNTSAMNMVFSAWGDYRLSVFLFPGCKIVEIWQFVLAWLIVFFSVVFHQWLKLFIANLENSMTGNRRPKVVTSFFSDNDDPECYFVNSNLKDFKKLTSSQILSMRILHSGLVGLSYALSLMLMLVAMTFNSLLFVALVIGYAIGDFLFFQLVAPVSVGSFNDDECH